MSIFNYVDTALLLLLGLGNVKTRRALRKDVARVRMYVLAHSHPTPVQPKDSGNV